ncbi:cyclase family protein [Natranaerobius trueperi]|uniref:Hydrolase n=1 Tax=Natranaerobius trueperi TaxID=759412 RepID=A0A226BY35_9FIRM|nr:cyclase family protein [Natranaerobius trueperi]OWZ83682.1 hydrolase [Natranaerobius trueperi]
MNIIDLTHSIHDKMPVYPGTTPPVFETSNTLETDGFIEKRITMFSHTGTHIDAPSHIFEDDISLDDFNIDDFIGKGTVINVKSNYEISKDILINHEQDISSADFLLFNTEWNKLWGKDDYYHDYPVLTTKAAKWLIDNFNLKGIGVDAISMDRAQDDHLPIHHLLLKNKLLIIENLTNLEKLENSFTFYCLPLKTQNSDGAPVRAIAIIQ